MPVFPTTPHNQPNSNNNVSHIQDALNTLQQPATPATSTTPVAEEAAQHPSQVDITTTWHKVLHELSLTLSLPSIEMWLMPLLPQSINLAQNEITLVCPSAFSQLWVSRHYLNALQSAFMSVLSTSQLPQISLMVTESNPVTPVESYQAPRQQAAAALPAIRATAPLQAVPNNLPIGLNQQPKPPIRHGNLNPKYTLANLIIGEHNQFATAAAKAVIANPGQQYNPLFIHGDVGLGKTHLMQAIGHQLIQNQPDLNYCYITTEQFANEMIAAINNKTIKRFQDKFRSLDLLMMDDIQFLEGKQRTQEEIFHIFNALVDNGKQIIFTSDRPPTQLTRLENRLTSRFGCGLTVDIKLPEVTVKKEIIAHKARLNNLNLTAEMVNILANQYTSNVRELEGMLTKLSAYQVFNQQPVTEAVLFDLLGITADVSNHAMTQNKPLVECLKQVACYYNVSLEDLQSASRKKTLNETRQTIIYILRTLTGASYPQLGELFGNRSHSNIMLACKKVSAMLESNTTLKLQMDKVLNQLGTI